ncbi:MAG: glycosyltransferase, partial [Candidatus Moraniibacteriota bacterium]
MQKNIDSLKNQTFKDFEHIFIDGFSTDKTMDIIEKYRKDFPEKVRVFQFPAKGIANAMNIGIEKSKGKYINHMHSDDSFYSNNTLDKISNFINKNNHPDWIYGKALFTDIENGNKRIIPHRMIYKKIRYWLFFLTNYIPHQSVFLKREMFEKYG